MVISCLFFNCYYADGYHIEHNYIDNEVEAVNFLNSGKVKNTTAFLMLMTNEDFEEDCSGVSGSNSLFEFRYDVYTLFGCIRKKF